MTKNSSLNIALWVVLLGALVLPAYAQLGLPVIPVSIDPTGGGACPVDSPLEADTAVSPVRLWACGGNPSPVWQQISGSPAATTINGIVCTPSGTCTLPNTIEAFTAGSGGVTANTCVKLDGSTPEKVIENTTADTGCYGVAQTTATATNPVLVVRFGQAILTADGSITQGDILLAGTGTGGYVKDSTQSSTLNIPATTRVVGVALQSAASSGNTLLVGLTPAHFGSGIFTGAIIPGDCGKIAASGAGYLVADAGSPCATTSAAVYSTQTITCTVVGGLCTMAIPASTHNQGQYAFGKCWSSVTSPQVEESCQWSRNPANGNLTVTYVTVPAEIDIFGAGEGVGAVYSTTTITGSPMTISASTHSQGQYAFMVCWTTSTNPQIQTSCNPSRNPANGDLTLTYTIAPGQIDVFGGGEGRGGGGTLFLSYQFGTNTPLTGVGLYLQEVLSSIFTVTQSGAGSAISPYIETIALASQPANCFLGAPNGSSGIPTCRALVQQDLPSTSTQTIASGTAALGTAAISSGACATLVTVSAPGVQTTDVLAASFNGDPTGIVGYEPTTLGMLTIIPYPSNNNINFKVCNNTSASVTPGAITLNWRVSR